MKPVSRRTFMAMLSAAAAPSFSHALAPSTNAALFESLPPGRTGINWKHTNGRSPDYYLPETTGAGCAFLDYDNDGWMDIYLVNSGDCDFFHPATPLSNALYRNNRDGTFTDVTLKAGVPGAGYGMGIAVGDYNRDGFPDMFVTGYNRSILYRNRGDGTFVDATAQSGIRIDGWATSAAWFDYDNDGQLDLFVCHFVQYTKADNRACGDGTRKERHYCVPRFYLPSACWLFHNNGDGTFTDVSAESGIAQLKAKAWGVVATDINNDGQMDLFVANDTAPNFLLINDHGKFKDTALEADVAYSSMGVARSGMGVDAADLDGDGWQDLFVTNVDREVYSLYRNNHDGEFDDLASSTGIGVGSRNMSGWGTRFFDYDNDGNIDLMIVDGHPDDQIELTKTGVNYLEPMLLFHNDGKVLHNVSAQAGEVFARPLAARGLAIGDFDNDGAVDALVSVNNGTPLLLKNTATHGNHWLGLHLKGVKANIDAVGAKVTWTVGDTTRSCRKTGGGSFMSSHDPRIVLGLGPVANLVNKLEVRWPLPSTRTDVFENVKGDQYFALTEGEALRALSYPPKP